MLTLQDDVVHLWYFDSGEQSPLDADTEASYIAALSESEAQRYNRLQIRQRQKQYLLGKFLVRQVLSHYREVAPLQWQFVESEHGKPMVTNQSPGLAFNLSHSRGMFTIAVTGSGETGVDVELASRPRRVMALARRHFSQAEIGALEALAEEQRLSRFYQLWTLNEAFVKARGLGLTMPLQDFTFEVSDAGVISLRELNSVMPLNWQFWTMQLEALAGEQHYTVSLAVANDRKVKQSLHVFQFLPGGRPVEKELAVSAVSV